MDESCVLLVNLHQLLVRFDPHAALWVCSHCNEVGYTLQTGQTNMLCSHAYVHITVDLFCRMSYYNVQLYY